MIDSESSETLGTTRAVEDGLTDKIILRLCHW